jgi:hypothetical protein
MKYVTYVCDRCKATFPQTDPARITRPLFIVLYKLYPESVEKMTEKDLCRPCRDGLNTVIKNYMDLGAGYA